MHHALDTVIDRIQKDTIGGAADIAKEVTNAIAEMINESNAVNREQLLGEVKASVIGILKVMSSFAPPVNAMNRLALVVEDGIEKGYEISDIRKNIYESRDQYLLWSGNAISRIAQYGAEKINDGDVVFTYSMSSTVWQILRNAKEQGKSFKVIVTESRPGNEGLWTVEKMNSFGIPVEISIDACIGELVPKGNIVFVGADAIASTGIVLCKVGTFPTALVAKRYGIPFYVAADTSKFDATTLIGLPFVSEPVAHYRHQVFLDKDTHEDWAIIGTMFDETTPDLISGIITEIGILPPEGCFSIMQQVKLSRMMGEILPEWVHGNL